jgi:hypothetical protein
MSLLKTSGCCVEHSEPNVCRTGQRLAVIGELDVLWLRQVGERETWCTDTQEAITAEVAAALGITQRLAASYLEYSRAMRLRLAAA